MEHLITMTDFVLEQSNKTTYTEDFYQPVVCYAEFLKKPLKLGYFIPCDENDVPLPKKYYPIVFGEEGDKYFKKYQEAKQRVLFEGFEYESENEWINYNEFSRFFISELQNGKIEDLHELITEKPKLTETAKKEIGI